MRKQSIYDFEKLFLGHNLKKTSIKETSSREATAQRERPKQTNSYIAKPTKPAGIKLHMKTSSTISSKGSSAQKTSRKPSQASIQLIVPKGDSQGTMGATGGGTLAHKYTREEVQNFYNGLGSTIVVKYTPISTNSEKKSIKRNLSNQFSGLRLGTGYAEQTLLMTKKPTTERSITTSQHKMTNSIEPHRQKLLTHKESVASISSISSSRYGSVNHSSNSLKHIQDKFKQSQEKINKLRDRLSHLYSLKTESSQKVLAKPKCKPTRYESILLR